MLYLMDDEDQKNLTECTFSELNMKESDVEEFLRRHIELICDDDETMLVVGQQVRNDQNGRSDLTALDGQGNLVLIEIKRDRSDIEARREAFEFQAIRYAASCASIDTREELVQNLYAPYVERHKDEFPSMGTLTSVEVAQRKLDEFASDNDIRVFNERQRVFLVASDFDAQTLSAVAWLDANNVDISCYRLSPYRIGDYVLIHSTKVLPLSTYDDLYVGIGGAKPSPMSPASGSRTRNYKPRIKDLIDNDVVSPGTILVPKNHEDVEAVLQQDGRVKLQSGETVKLNPWLQEVYGWSSVDVYEWAVEKTSGKTLDELRSEWLESQTDSDEADTE